MKTMLITGSESQLGKAYVGRFLDLGYSVFGFDLLPQSQNSKLIYRKVDITKPKEIGAALDSLDKEIDVLVNNAGNQIFTPFEERTEEELDLVIGANLKGTIIITKELFNRFFKPKKRGCIVNIGSIYGVVATDMRLYKEGDRRSSEIYGATKAAIIQLTKYFAAYMAPYNVRVNCISPGGIFNHQNGEFVEKYSAKVPFSRMGRENELLSTLEYLVSEQSTYTTGQNIIVDGGLTVW